MRLKCRWKNAGHPSVFKVATGEAVHTMGFAYVNGRFLGMNHYRESADIRRCIEICGGNIKRGLMFFVESMMRKSASDILDQVAKGAMCVDCSIEHSQTRPGTK